MDEELKFKNENLKSLIRQSDIIRISLFQRNSKSVTTSSY
jgi:hypothetical protein